MKKSVYFALVLLSVTIIATFGCQSSAHEGCSSLLEVTNVEDQSPKIAEFLSSRSYDRLIRTQPEALSRISDQIVAAPEGRTHIHVSEDDFGASIYVTKENGMIDVNIKYVSFSSGETGVRRVLKGMFTLGKRNPSLNMLFPRIIAAIASGLERVITDDPSLKTISISGASVVNLSLTKQLRELGFEPDSPNAFKLFINAFRKEGGYAVWIHNIALWTGLMGAIPEVMHLPIKVVKNAVIIVAGFRYRELGRNWKIEFQVQRKAAPQ